MKDLIKFFIKNVNIYQAVQLGLIFAIVQAALTLFSGYSTWFYVFLMALDFCKGFCISAIVQIVLPFYR